MMRYDKKPSSNVLSQSTADGSGGGCWETTVPLANPGVFANLVRPVGFVRATSKDVSFSIGGYVTKTTDPSLTVLPIF
jgi:hypothetical protein